MEKGVVTHFEIKLFYFIGFTSFAIFPINGLTKGLFNIAETISRFKIRRNSFLFYLKSLFFIYSMSISSALKNSVSLQLIALSLLRKENSLLFIFTRHSIAFFWLHFSIIINSFLNLRSNDNFKKFALGVGIIIYQWGLWMILFYLEKIRYESVIE